MVILDEATAHLDSTSEAAVQAALAEALAGRTAVVIAHRLSTVRAADLILVVEDGRIVERGRHAELLALGGRYEELYRTQFQEDATPRRMEPTSGRSHRLPASHQSLCPTSTKLAPRPIMAAPPVPAHRLDPAWRAGEPGTRACRRRRPRCCR